MSDLKQEKTKPTPAEEPPLNIRDVKIRLATLGWTQSQLAKKVGSSLTSVNLSINHNTFPEVTKRIRQALR